MSNVVVVTTFAPQHFEPYAKGMLESFAKFWPAEIPLLVQLDNDLLLPDIRKILRPQDAFSVGWAPDHAAFVERNKDKEDTQDYRKQAVRFCHKVFAIKRVLDSVADAKSKGALDTPRYLIWMDADVHTTRTVALDEIKECLPKEGDAVAYLGRKDWPHSECGWLTFDLENGGDIVIKETVSRYMQDDIFNLEQWHDSWVFDKIRQYYTEGNQAGKWTNLTLDKPGMDIWPHSPMGKWSIHYKGPAAKQQLAGVPIQQPRPAANFVIQTKNSVPNEVIHANIRTNQVLIKNWVRPCDLNDEEIVVVSAGPSLVAEDVFAEKGKKIVAVKHALERLEDAGIVPWACILLDPRPHVAKFVEKPDPRVKWFVASQVDPGATAKLLEAGCEVWGYHAAVGAKEEFLTNKQQYSVISGGSATATRGLYLLNHLGFRNFTLYGYELSHPDRPDMKTLDERGQPKYVEMSVGFNNPLFCNKRVYWTEPQFMAQFDEIDQILKEKPFNIDAMGFGIIPFVNKAKKTGDLREKKLRAKMAGERLPHYDYLWNSNKKISFLTTLRRKSPLTLLKRKRNAS